MAEDRVREPRANYEANSRIENEEHQHSAEAKRVIGVNTTGKVIETADTSDDGGIIKKQVTNQNSEQLLSDIFKELKKINLHLALLNDINIENTEVN